MDAYRKPTFDQPFLEWVKRLTQKELQDLADAVHQEMGRLPDSGRHKGPRVECPYCGAHLYHMEGGGRVWITFPKGCQPENRLALGWFAKCELFGTHLHQQCSQCKLRWVCDPKDG